MVVVQQCNFWERTLYLLEDVTQLIIVPNISSIAVLEESK